MPSFSVLATGLSGVGLTIASAFVTSLGLSVHQQRIGFGVGVVLMLVGATLYFYQSQRRARPDSRGVEAEADHSSTATAAGRDAYSAGRDVNVSVAQPQQVPDALKAARRELRDNREKLAEAQKAGSYDYHLSIGVSKYERADEATEDADLRVKLDAAYGACKRLKRRLKSRGHRGINGDIVQVVAEDEVPQVLDAIDAALGEL